MDPILGGLITGGASLLGNFMSSQTSASNTQAQIAGQEKMQAESEQFNAAQAETNRQFQQMMSSTAYQRATADMRAAGLNPMMMFGSGSAASTPGGSSASIGTPTMPTPQRTSPFAGLGDVMSKAINSAIQVKTFDKMSDEIAALRAEAASKTAEAGLKTTQAGYIRGPQTAQAGAETAKAQATTRLIDVNKVAAVYGLDVDELKSKEGRAILEFARNHPDLFSTGVVGAYGARKVDDIISPVMSAAKAYFGARLGSAAAGAAERSGVGRSGREVMTRQRDGSWVKSWEQFPE